jgi:hypothetical protein
MEAPDEHKAVCVRAVVVVAFTRLERQSSRSPRKHMRTGCRLPCFGPLGLVGVEFVGWA